VKGLRVRINSDRSGRLVFDNVAGDYDASRPVFDAGIVEWVCREASIEPTAKVLEIGAGSGQLTAPLLDRGCLVTALEPGRELRSLLSEKLGSHPSLTISGHLFEDFEEEQGGFQAVLAANSFQWIDPDTAYVKASRLLSPGGSLVLLWNFPVLDPEIQPILNEKVFQAQAPDFVRNPETFMTDLERELARGRDEIVGSGRFLAPAWVMAPTYRTLDTDTYVQLLRSYANAARLDGEAWARLESAVRSGVSELGHVELRLTDNVYALVSRRV
jgi:SAM-dependent methyltransferase